MVSTVGTGVEGRGSFLGRMNLETNFLSWFWPGCRCSGTRSAEVSWFGTKQLVFLALYYNYV